MKENFADLIQNAVTVRRSEVETANEARYKARTEADSSMKELFRPITTLLRQAKEAYSGLSMMDAPHVTQEHQRDDGTWMVYYYWPHFYYSGSGSYQISHENMVFCIRDKNHPHNDIVATYDYVEDLIPPLVAMIAKVVTNKGLDKKRG